MKVRLQPVGAAQRLLGKDPTTVSTTRITAYELASLVILEIALSNGLQIEMPHQTIATDT